MKPGDAESRLSGNRPGAVDARLTGDGARFDPSASSYGTGLRGIADRLAALDGWMEIRSTLGGGTTQACLSTPEGDSSLASGLEGGDP
jgi:glucose-6-phosphate-specific signal transduction histidine kinase